MTRDANALSMYRGDTSGNVLEQKRRTAKDQEQWVNHPVTMIVSMKTHRQLITW